MQLTGQADQLVA